MKLCLNGHEWAKRQLEKRKIRYQARDNGFCRAPNQSNSSRSAIPWGRSTSTDCFGSGCSVCLCPCKLKIAKPAMIGIPSIWQMEVSLRQIFDRPVRGREFFEEVIRDNLDLGRPDRVQLIFDRGVANLPYLQKLGRQINRRLLEVERVSHNSGLSGDSIQRVVQPTVNEDGEKAPALKFGQPRVMALFLALTLFQHLIDGFHNRDLRAQVADLLGVPSANTPPAR